MAVAGKHRVCHGSTRAFRQVCRHVGTPSLSPARPRLPAGGAPRPGRCLARRAVVHRDAGRGPWGCRI